MTRRDPLQGETFARPLTGMHEELLKASSAFSEAMQKVIESLKNARPLFEALGEAIHKADREIKRSWEREHCGVPMKKEAIHNVDGIEMDTFWFCEVCGESED